jgi:hypothetical protein
MFESASAPTTGVELDLMNVAAAETDVAALAPGSPETVAAEMPAAESGSTGSSSSSSSDS